MWGDADTAIGGNRDRFPSTQASLIAAAAGEPPAMERVMALYWKPVYKFIRLRFHQDNEAAAATRGRCDALSAHLERLLIGRDI